MRTAAHNLRAGADWRSPDYAGPPVGIGDQQTGTWRATTEGEPGQAIEANAEWLEAIDGDRRLAMVMERNDQPSSRARYDGTTARLEVDYERDLILLGPLEENAHFENPYEDGGRRRVVLPGEPFALEPAFVALGARDGDAEWQHHRYLVGHRLTPYPKAITFNSNGTDSNVRSTGAKDDLDIDVIREIAPKARRLGIETFILDDGWQARSGDWQPDSPEFPEPRPEYGPRFPDSEFTAVREAIAPMRLGLWWTPLHFHPSSETYKQHPEWICHPIGDGLLAYNTAEPESSSNEAGLVTWGPDALPHVEARLTDAIENWGVRYFKWDFMAWLDCAGQGDVYDFREELLGHARPAAGEVPGRHVPDRRDERLPPVPLRVGRARAVVVPERIARVRPAPPQHLEPQPVRARLVARPALPRREGVGEAPRGDAHGRGAPVAPHVLQRPAGDPRRGHRGGAALARALQAPPRASSRR